MRSQNFGGQVNLLRLGTFWLLRLAVISLRFRNSQTSWGDLCNLGEISVKVFHGTGYNIATTCTVCTCKQLYGNLFTAFINYFFLQLNMLKGKVKDITFKGTVDMLKSCALQNGKVPLVSIQLSV